MTTIDFPLDELRKKLQAGQFRIPQFQRDFIWRISQVRLLVDSLSRNYPIGSILLLPEANEVSLQSRAIDAIFKNDEIIPELEGSKVEAFYVLDGQQRLTSIARVFLNADPKKTFYVDLRKLYTGFSSDKHDWVVTRQRGKNDPDRKDKNRLIRADIILDKEKADIYVVEYVEDSDDFAEYRTSKNEARIISAKIKSIFETIRNYRIPAVMLEKDAGIESICRVFETINSTGTRLTTFDLAVARFYPIPDLREMMGQAMEKFAILKEFDVNGERVLQVLWLLYAKEVKTQFEPTRGSLLSLKPQTVIDNWDFAVESLANAYQLVRDENGARPENLPNESLLVSTAAFMALYPSQLKTASFRPLFRRWFFSNALQQGARQAVNYEIGQDFHALVRYAELGEPLKIPRVALTTEKIIGLNKADNRRRGLLCLMAMTVKEDLITGAPLSVIEDHHIFPRALHKHGLTSDKIESIVNRILISLETNRTLSDKKPSSYLAALRDSALQNGTAPDVSRRLRESFLPDNLTNANFANQFETHRYDEFLENRARLLLEKVREVVGDSLEELGVPNDDDEETDD